METTHEQHQLIIFTAFDSSLFSQEDKGYQSAILILKSCKMRISL
ncbi:hypothetical protein H1P_320001 [Hyella patelloides LEGE 07179]|uniref:Uncharacterized protein n=1 Tax=Hyella patelloides LEGE 07179 TaxID=945734 RepID=A0A563VUW9_9CYAN|nr:hypothetical protein [Hyella patelloides]VEP15230.1 hypothetical protein H1P_320001 [Hyella patelloides LEGE 07179]